MSNTKTWLFTLLALAAVCSKNSIKAYEIGCIYPEAMPDPIEAQNIMVKYTILATQYGKVETPIAVHNGLISALCGGLCLAHHDPAVLDPLTMERPFVLVPEFGHNAYSVALCSLQCHALAVGLDAMQPLFEKWDINITERWHPDLAFLRDDEEGESTTDKILKAVTVIKEHDFHPFLMGQLVGVKILYLYALEDGWNTFGLYTYDTLSQSIVNTTGKYIPYADLSGYFPRNHPGRPYNESEKYIVEGDDMYWQPLLEEDGRGYFSRQQHVVPHLATTATTFLPDLRNKTIDPPNYDYYNEALKVVEELRLTAANQTRQSQVQIFDNKFDVRGLFQDATKAQFAGQHSYQRELLLDMGLSFAENDATILAWTEKIRHDLVRPTTVIKRWGGDPLITYGGDPDVMQPIEIAARDFEAFIRVMPHSEFPSGSACLCTTYRAYMDRITQDWYGDTLSEIKYGGDDGHTYNCNGEVHPDLWTGYCGENYTFTLKDMKDVEYVCGQSRLWGGMHFTKAVPSGHELCEGIAEPVVEWVKEVMADSDFGGNEFFQGDERPQCSVPTKMDGYAETNGSSGANLVGRSGAVMIAAISSLMFIIAELY